MSKHFKRLLWLLPLACGLGMLVYFWWNHAVSMLALQAGVPYHLVIFTAFIYALTPALMGTFTGLQLSLLLFLLRGAFLLIRRQWQNHIERKNQARLVPCATEPLKEDPLVEKAQAMNDNPSADRASVMIDGQFIHAPVSKRNTP